MQQRGIHAVLRVVAIQIRDRHQLGEDDGREDGAERIVGQQVNAGPVAGITRLSSHRILAGVRPDKILANRVLGRSVRLGAERGHVPRAHVAVDG